MEYLPWFSSAVLGGSFKVTPWKHRLQRSTVTVKWSYQQVHWKEVPKQAHGIQPRADAFLFVTVQRLKLVHMSQCCSNCECAIWRLILNRNTGKYWRIMCVMWEKAPIEYRIIQGVDNFLGRWIILYKRRVRTLTSGTCAMVAGKQLRRPWKAVLLLLVKVRCYMMQQNWECANLRRDCICSQKT